MVESTPRCSRCGLPMDPEAKCSVCGVPLCPYELRELEGYGALCPACYKDLSFQYHSKKCDVGRSRHKLRSGRGEH